MKSSSSSAPTVSSFTDSFVHINQSHATVKFRLTIMSHYLDNTTVISPEGALMCVRSKFTDKVLLPFHGRDPCRSYHDNVEILSILTSRSPGKRRTLSLGYLRSKAKNVPSNLSNGAICVLNSLKCALAHLNQAYAVYKSF